MNGAEFSQSESVALQCAESRGGMPSERSLVMAIQNRNADARLG